MKERIHKADVAIIGGGIAGLVTALELLERDKTVVLVDRDSEERAGGLARMAFGGMMLVGTPEQRRMKIDDNPALALRDWESFANFNADDHWPRKWAEAYVHECRPLVYDWLLAQGLRFLPAVNWVERGLFRPGNSVPRYHILWGTGSRLAGTLLARLRGHPNAENLSLLFRYRVDTLEHAGGSVTGCSGIDEASGIPFTIRTQAVVVASGGINGSTERVKANWPRGWGAAPSEILNGAHPNADGRVHDCVAQLGGRLTHLDKMWNYAAGVAHPRPHFDGHGLSLIPCKSALWMDHTGARIGPVPLVTGFDTHDLCRRVAQLERPYSWQVLNWRIAARELAVSGAEHNPSIRDHKALRFLREILFGNQRLVRQMVDESPDFLVADTVAQLAAKMNALAGDNSVDPERLERELAAYDANFQRPYSMRNDDQIRRIEHARCWRPDRLRTCKPAPLVDPRAGPLMAIRVRLISRKSLGGIQTDLQGGVLSDTGEPIGGLYAVGEAAGFGGGGASGQRSLEGTFLSGCILTARKAAPAIADAVS